MSFAIIVPTRDFPAGMFHEFSLRDRENGLSSGEIAAGRDFELRIAKLLGLMFVLRLITLCPRPCALSPVPFRSRILSSDNLLPVV